MSRTFRRKKSKIPKWVYTKIVYENINDKLFIKTITLDGKELDKAISRFRSDKDISSIPWIKRRLIEKQKRSKDKRILDIINKKGYYHEYVFDIRKNDLKQTYW